MMNTASLELSKALYELGGWDETFLKWYEFVGDDFDLYSEPLLSNKSNNYRQKEGTYICPAYDLGYLLRKIHAEAHSHEDLYLVRWKDGEEWKCWTIQYPNADATSDTPEDAACKLAIELFRQGILKKERRGSR